MLSYLNAKILNLFYEVRMEIILLFHFAPCKYFNVSIFLTDIQIIINTTDTQRYGQPIVGRDDITDDLSTTCQLDNIVSVIITNINKLFALHGET